MLISPDMPSAYVPQSYCDDCSAFGRTIAIALQSRRSVFPSKFLIYKLTGSPCQDSCGTPSTSFQLHCTPMSEMFGLLKQPRLIQQGPVELLVDLTIHKESTREWLKQPPFQLVIETTSTQLETYLASMTLLCAAYACNAASLCPA